MTVKPINRILDFFRARGSSLRSYICEKPCGDGNREELDFDQSNKQTFFAWQRNHMANERTFLSWCRTGISLIAFGFVIERFDILIREMRFVAPGFAAVESRLGSTRYLGLTTFILGAVIVLLAGWRFFYIRRHINRGGTDFSALPDIFLMGSVLFTVITTLVFFVFLF